MTTMTLPIVGKPAPDFSLPSTADEEVTLSSFQGKSHVVLAFFPLAFTSVCTEEMGCFTDDFAAFEGVDAKVFGISVDAVPALKEFKAKHGFAIDFLSDFKRDVCRSYGTLIEDTFFSKRAYIIVDRQGITRWVFVEAELGDRRDNAELLEQLRGLA